MTNENQNWLDKLRSAAPAELWAQIDDLSVQLKKISEAEFNCLLERMKKGETTAIYSQIYARMTGTEIVDEWDAINARWQALNEDQWKRLESARKITLGILELLTKLALVGVFL